jgi:valyl-tRNA synthetase
MDGKANHVAAILTSVAGYGGQLAAVFHNYALTAEKIPPGFEGAVNILDATVAVLKQVLKLAKDDAEGKKLFSVKGLTYVQALAQESAKTMAKVEPIIAEACLHRDEREAKRKQSKKTKKVLTEIDPISLKIDEKDFFNKVEAVKWSLAKNAIDNCMERLYDLQLHLLLVSEVVKVGAFWKEL